MALPALGSSARILHGSGHVACLPVDSPRTLPPPSYLYLAITLVRLDDFDNACSAYEKVLLLPRPFLQWRASHSLDVCSTLSPFHLRHRLLSWSRRRCSISTMPSRCKTTMTACAPRRAPTHPTWFHACVRACDLRAADLLPLTARSIWLPSGRYLRRSARKCRIAMRMCFFRTDC